MVKNMIKDDEFEKDIQDIYEEFAENQEDLGAEFRLSEEQLWELLGS